MDASVRDKLLAADRRFAADVAAAAGAARAQAWAGWFASDGRQLVPGRVVVGREAVHDLMEPFFADPANSLAWSPDQGGGAGDRGWTSGRYVSRTGGSESEGRYLTVWVRIDGRWQVDVDTGVPDG